MKRIGLCLFLFLAFLGSVQAEDLTPNSESAILLEVSTGKVVYEKNANAKLEPASMTKVMSMLLIMEAIDGNELSLDDDVVISDNASSMGGSQIFLQTGEKYKVRELLKGIAIASGNDAVVAMAEKVSGSVSAFVEAMNNKAKALGLTNTHFDNPHGLHSENHYTTARDMSVIARELLKHETILEFTSIYEDYLKKPDGSSVWLVNTNKLVRFYEGVDGLKTGFTSEAGYCITTTAKRNNMRLLSVVMKAETTDLRSKDTVSMLNYGFNTYKIHPILTKEENLGEVHIIKGEKLKARVYLQEDVNLLGKVSDGNQEYHYNVIIDEVKAPINENSKVGKVEVLDQENHLVQEADLVIKETVDKASFFTTFKRVLGVFTQGILE